MSDTNGSRFWDQPVVRVIRFVVPWIFLAVVLFRINGIYEDYKVMKVQQAKQAAETTAALLANPARSTSLKKGMKLVVLKDGLNLRSKPQATSGVVMKLERGDVLAVLKADDQWVQIETKDDKTGWILSDARYTKVQE